MQKKMHTKSYSHQELDKIERHGGDLTDDAAIDALTEEELEGSIDLEDEGEIDWNTIQVGLPLRKRQITVRLDSDVIDYFRSEGPGYQTRMNAVLRSYVDAQRKSA